MSNKTCQTGRDICKRRTLQELTIKDNFMFAAVMLQPENCRLLLEMILAISIERVEVITEKSIVYHPEYHGIRLDVFAKEPAGTRFSVGMQVSETPVRKRIRYYHSEIDADLLLAGTSYEELPDAYVIFICDYDPFGAGKYCYTVDARIRETGEAYEDGSHTLILSTAGENACEMPPDLVKFLHFVHADLAESTEDFGDEFVRRLQDSVRRVKASREMEKRFMVLEEMLRKERREGFQEGKLEGLQEGKQEGLQEGIRRSILLLLAMKYGDPSDHLKGLIAAQGNSEVLQNWLLLVSKTTSPEEFLQEIEAAER